MGMEVECCTDCRVSIVPTLLLSSLHIQEMRDFAALPITYWYGSVLMLRGW